MKIAAQAENISTFRGYRRWGEHPIAPIRRNHYDAGVKRLFQTGGFPDLTAGEHGGETATLQCWLGCARVGNSGGIISRALQHLALVEPALK